jgi:hypothetical protein
VVQDQVLLGDGLVVAAAVVPVIQAAANQAVESVVVEKVKIVITVDMSNQ